MATTLTTLVGTVGKTATAVAATVVNVAATVGTPVPATSQVFLLNLDSLGIFQNEGDGIA